MGLRSGAIALIISVTVLLEGVVTFASGLPKVLYDRPGHPSADYDETVKSIKSRDLLRFSNGKTFRVIRKLGNGGTAIIFQAEDTQSKKRFALRVPISTYFGSGEDLQERMSDYLSSYFYAQKVYEKAGVPVVEIFPELSFPKEYVAVEELNIEFTLKDVISSGGKIPLETKKHVLGQPLTDFAKTLWNFSLVGDSRPENIGWVNGRWVFFDMTDEFELYQAGDITPPRDLLHLTSYRQNLDKRLDLNSVTTNVKNAAFEERRRHHFAPELKESDPIVTEAHIRREYLNLVNERTFWTDPKDKEGLKRIDQHIQMLRREYRYLRLQCVIDFLNSGLPQ